MTPSFLRIISIICVAVAVLLNYHSRFIEASMYMIIWAIVYSMAAVIDRLDTILKKL